MDTFIIEDLKRNINILEHLANGRNPKTGELLPNDTILNDPENVRCFFTALTLMKNCLKSTETKQLREKRKNQVRFTITEEQKQRACSTQTKKITEFVRTIREIIGDEMELAMPKNITSWLVKQGYLEISTKIVAGIQSKVPTRSGEELGITAKTILTDDGRRYILCTYAKEAQMFILDNMENILGYNEPESEPEDN